MATARSDGASHSSLKLFINPHTRPVRGAVERLHLLPRPRQHLRRLALHLPLQQHHPFFFFFLFRFLFFFYGRSRPPPRPPVLPLTLLVLLRLKGQRCGAQSKA